MCFLFGQFLCQTFCGNAVYDQPDRKKSNDHRQRDNGPGITDKI
jgi:hypothetical protein